MSNHDNEVGRSLDMKMDKAVIKKLEKTKWFQSMPFWHLWSILPKRGTRNKTRQIILDTYSFDIALALRGKDLQVYLYKNDERGDRSPYVVKNGHEWTICAIDEISLPGEPPCLTFDPWWMGCYETEEEAHLVCEEMKWTLCKKRTSNV